MFYNADDLDVNTIVRKTGRTERTVRNWIREGKVESYHLGTRCIRVRRASFDAFMASNPIT
jgi:excisionase family DNA binding protein